MKTKVQHFYRSSQYLQHQTYITLNGEQFPILFSGGTRKPYIRFGFFITDNPEIIKAIETDPRFGKEFKRERPEISEVTDLENPQTQHVFKVEDITEVNAAATESVNPRKNFKVVTGITSGQKAKAYLLKTYRGKVKSLDLRTNAAIVAIADAHKIYFIDWEEIY